MIKKDLINIINYLYDMKDEGPDIYTKDNISIYHDKEYNKIITYNDDKIITLSGNDIKTNTPNRYKIRTFLKDIVKIYKEETYNNNILYQELDNIYCKDL